MMSSNNESRDRDLKLACLIASGAVVIFFVTYWSIQIQNVLDLLALAQGG